MTRFWAEIVQSFDSCWGEVEELNGKQKEAPCGKSLIFHRGVTPFI